jgi:hypothetical protein
MRKMVLHGFILLTPLADGNHASFKIDFKYPGEIIIYRVTARNLLTNQFQKDYKQSQSYLMRFSKE